MSYEPWPRLEKRTRLKLLALGAAAWLAAVPAGFAGLMIFGFHGPVGDRGWDEIIAFFALPLLPLLLVLLGLACLLCSTRLGLAFVRGLASASAVAFVLLLASFHSMNRPKDYSAALVSPELPPRSAGRAMAAPPGPVSVAIACSAVSDECWTIRSENGREVSRKRSAGPKRDR